MTQHHVGFKGSPLSVEKMDENFDHFQYDRPGFVVWIVYWLGHKNSNVEYMVDPRVLLGLDPGPGFMAKTWVLESLGLS